MAGIVSYGSYVPRYRIDRKLIYRAMGWINPASYIPGERAVTNFDEDSLTMAVSAATDCMRGIDRSVIGAVYFASSTAPYSERQSASILATAMDARPEIRSADFTNSLKAGTSALLAALDAVRARAADTVLVAVGESRNAKAGSAQEEIFGDAAAAVLVGRDNLVARFVGAYSMSHDFPDHWRSAGEAWDHQWEDRFIRDEGYTKFIVDALTGLARSCSVEVSAFTSIIYPCLYQADFKTIAKRLNLEPSRLVEPLLGQVGYSGAADPLVHLAKVLEDANAGELIAVVGYGSGADAILLEVTDGIDVVKKNRKGIRAQLSARRELTSYEKMITWRGLMQVEKGMRGETVPYTAMSALWRDRHQILGLRGTRCLACGTPQFPAQKVCVNPACGAIGKMEPYRFSDKRGSLFTYTADNLVYSQDPPAISGTVDFEGGGRYCFDLTDVDQEQVKVGMQVEMSFRKKYTDPKFGVHGYFWKAVPVLDE